MRFARLDDEGRPIAFYDDAVHTKIPDDAVDISEDDWREALENPGCRRLDSDGFLSPCDPPPPPAIDADEARAYIDARLEGDPLIAVLVEAIADEATLTVDDIRARMLSRMGVEADG